MALCTENAAFWHDLRRSGSVEQGITLQEAPRLRKTTSASRRPTARVEGNFLDASTANPAEGGQEGPLLFGSYLGVGITITGNRHINRYPMIPAHISPLVYALGNSPSRKHYRFFARSVTGLPKSARCSGSVVFSIGWEIGYIFFSIEQTLYSHLDLGVTPAC